MAYTDVINVALRSQLMQRLERDQAVRVVAVIGGPRPAELVEACNQIDRDNTRFLRSVVAEHGWPGEDLVGAGAATAAWVLAQHADEDPGFQRDCLALVQDAVARGQAEPMHLAYLTDRVLTAQGLPQRYGTQYRADGGAMRPLPIDDPEHVDQRRAEAGLEPQAEYDRKMNPPAGGRFTPAPGGR